MADERLQQQQRPLPRADSDLNGVRERPYERTSAAIPGARTITVEGTGKPVASVSVVVYDDYYALNAPIARGTTGATGVYDISFKGQCRANSTYSVLANSGLGAPTGESLFKSFDCITGGGELNFVVTAGSAGAGS